MLFPLQNFSCFSNLELQQDYYNKNQVAIFIVLVIRHRRSREYDEANAGYSYQLPSHLTCDLHTFVSGDRKHDDGLAMLAWEKVAQHTKEIVQQLGLPPRKVIMWSDGAPNQVHPICSCSEN